MRNTYKNYGIAILLLAMAVPALASAQDVDEEEAAQEEQTAAAVEEDALELRGQTVTGSRLVGGDQTARVYSFSAEEIARLGVSSLEELMRTLPWAFSSINTQTDTYFGAGASDTDKSLGALGLGTSTVNLRALGSANTLVLLNGRRVAGVAGDEDNFVNLVNVPLSSIERVDIQLDGASAVYGADAIGGVVNFITKKNYQGASATVRQEFSSTDADKTNISLQGGYAWGTGNITATASRDTSEPISNFKTGWTTSDYRDRFGPEFDARRPVSRAQPGIVCDFNGNYSFPGCPFRGRKWQLRPGHSGSGATPEDFTTELTPSDYIRPQNGADSTNNSFTANIEQYLTDSFRIYADVLYSKHESFQAYSTSMSNYLIPASNAYNPFGRTVVVSYWPIAEIESGAIPQSYTESENKQRNYGAGFIWEFGSGHQLELNLSRSKSERFGWQIRTDYRRREFDPSQEKFYSALASSDPNVALNLFGDGSAQGSAFGELFTSALGPSYGYTERTTWEPLLRGQLFRLWGGPIDYALGAEFREGVVYRESEDFVEGGASERSNTREGVIGVARPTQELAAYFFELALPFVGKENARPGLQELVLSLQARRDTYKAQGAAGGVSREIVGFGSTRRVFIPGQGWTDQVSRRPNYGNVGSPDLIETSQSDTSPRVAIRYAPTQKLALRAAWSQSFRPPVFSDQFNTREPSEMGGYYVDPYHPDGIATPIQPPVNRSSFNTEIRSEISDNYSLGFDWSPSSLPGLRWTVDWSRINFTDKIDHASNLLFNHPEIAFAIPEIVERDADGYITLINDTQLNLAKKVSELLDTRLEYGFVTSAGDFTARLNYTRVLDEYFQVAEDGEKVARQGTASGSNEYKLSGALNWLTGRFAVDLNVYYIPGYENDRTGYCGEVAGRCGGAGLFWPRPSLEVDALTTVALTVAYRFDNGVRIRGGGRNILDADLSTLWNNLPYDPTRWDARGRVFFLELHYEM